MATEYKFMFDRRFDEEEQDLSAPEDMSVKSVDGIPSISQLLDSLNEKMNAAKEGETPVAEEDLEALVKEMKEPATEENLETLVKEMVDPAAGTDETTLPAEKNAPSSTTEAPDPDGNVEEEKGGDSGQGTEQAPENETNRKKQPDDTPEVPEFAVEKPVNIFPEERQSPPPSNIFPVFSEDQLKAAEEKAREEGRLIGLEEGRETAWQEAMVSLQKQNADTLISIDASLKNILGELEQSAQTAYSTAVDFAMAVCKKAVPAFCETNAVQEIRALLEKNLHFLKDEPKISLRLNPFLADQIKPVLTDLVKKEAYSGKIAVVRDDTLPAGDCRVEWKNGGMQKNVQDVLNQTEELIALYTHTAPAGKPEADQTGEKDHG